MELLLGDCIERMKELADNSVDAVVTDPPYGLSFMGKKWDYDVPGVEVWREALRVLKPGGHLLSFGGSRTYHRMACAIEDAGFEIRDQIMWVYGCGFPKNLNIGKAVDKLQGNERETIPNFSADGRNRGAEPSKGRRINSNVPINGGIERNEFATKGTSEWEGWGTALKPAHEPIVVARRPFKGTVADNVLKHGTGALNIDGCRVGTDQTVTLRSGSLGKGIYGGDARVGVKLNPTGRFPANLIHDNSAEVKECFPSPHGAGHAKYSKNRKPCNATSYNMSGGKLFRIGDSGSAARFFKACEFDQEEQEARRIFYSGKASKKDRDEGLDGFEEKATNDNAVNDSNMISSKWIIDARHKDGGYLASKTPPRKNHHATVKPTSLMQFLCKLVTPPGGVVLDPFMGSGSTGKAAVKEGFDFIGIEREPEYLEIAKARIDHAIRTA
jgi:DNA modification methylase